MIAPVPAEWSLHRALWLGFPSHGELWEDDLAPAQAEVAALAKALAGPGAERVRRARDLALSADADAQTRAALQTAAAAVDERSEDGRPLPVCRIRLPAAFAAEPKRGGTLVTIVVSDQLAGKVSDILKKHSPASTGERAAEWTAEGWVSLDVGHIDATLATA